jgi:hypothetical protein
MPLFRGCRGTLRNEPNLRGKRLNWHGGRRLGNGCGRRRGPCLGILEGFEGAEVHAVIGVDAPVKAGEGIDGVLIGVAERRIVLDGGVDEFGVGEIFVETFDLVMPELGFDAAEAAREPLGVD